jgi:hypothetical protein
LPGDDGAVASRCGGRVTPGAAVGKGFTAGAEVLEWRLAEQEKAET